MSEKVSGNLIIIGGAEDKKGDKDILRRVAKYIDPEKERLIIATIATQYPEQSYQNYKEVFTKLGIKNIALGGAAIGYVVTALILIFVYNLSKKKVIEMNNALIKVREAV